MTSFLLFLCFLESWIERCLNESENKRYSSHTSLGTVSNDESKCLKLPPPQRPAWSPSCWGQCRALGCAGPPGTRGPLATEEVSCALPQDCVKGSGGSQVALQVRTTATTRSARLVSECPSCSNTHAGQTRKARVALCTHSEWVTSLCFCCVPVTDGLAIGDVDLGPGGRLDAPKTGSGRQEGPVY